MDMSDRVLVAEVKCVVLLNLLQPRRLREPRKDSGAVKAAKAEMTERLRAALGRRG